MDGLTGLPEAVQKVYPQAILQRCIVHITRNIYAITAKKECKEVISDFKKIYTSNNLDASKLEYENFKGRRYCVSCRFSGKVNAGNGGG